MRIEPRFLNWGLFFIVLGAVPLAVRQGLVDRSTVEDLWQLWPVIIIGTGVGLILRQTSVSFVGGLIVAVVFGLVLGGLIATGGGFDLGDVACGNTRSTTAFPGQQGTLSGQSGSVVLDFDCGDLSVTTAAGSGWSLSGSATRAEAPIVDASGERLSVRSRHRGAVTIFGLGEDRETWRLTLPRDVTMTLDATINAARATLDLTAATVDSIGITANAADVRLDLGTTAVRRLSASINAGGGKIVLPDSSLSGSLTVNAGSISICAPPGVGLRLTANENITAGNNFAERGLSKSGPTWESAGYADATHRIDLTTTANAGSFTLNPEDGCR